MFNGFDPTALGGPVLVRRQGVILPALGGSVLCSLTGLLSALFVALAGLAQGYRYGLLLWLARLHLGFDV